MRLSFSWCLFTLVSLSGSAQGKITGRFFHRATHAYTTFYINPASDTGASLTVLNRRRIVDAVKATLVKKGLTPGDASADLLVNIVSMDSSLAGQRAGRPLNDWYRLFHGTSTGPGTLAGQEPVGTLLPASLLQNMDSTRSRQADTTPARDTVTPPPPPIPGPAYVYGAVIVDVIDKGKRILIWEGVVNRPLDVPMKDPDKRISPVVIRLTGMFNPAGGDPTDATGKTQTPK